MASMAIMRASMAHMAGTADAMSETMAEHGNGAHGPSFIGFGVSGVHVGVDNGYGCSPTDKAYIGGFCGDYVPY